MATAFPSGTNTFVPSFEASGELTVAFSRNPKRFPINQWTTLTKVEKGIGYYLQITAEEAARVISADLSDFVWPDGNDADDDDRGDESFNFVPYETKRYRYNFRIGYKAEKQASWKVLAAYAAFKAQQAMVARTLKCAQVALTAANYAASHQSTATTLGGGFFSAGTTSNPFIQKALRAMAQQIQIDTVNAVDPSDLAVVVNPTVATAMAASSEIQDYLKNSPFALAQVRGDAPNQNSQWGLPDQLYGFKVIIEDTIRVTSRKGATRAAGYLFSNNTNGQLVMLARPSQLSPVAGGPSFGSIHVMSYEEMTVEQKDDPDNRRIKGRVVDDFDVQFVAPATAYFLDHVLA